MSGLVQSPSNDNSKEKALTIIVQGTSSITRTAERAIVAIQLTTEDKDPETVLKQVTSSAKQLQSSFTQLSPKTESGEPATDAAITAWSMRTLHTSSYVPRDTHGADLDRKYSASTSFELEFHDFAKLSTVTSQLLAMPDVSIYSTVWRLTEKTKKSLGSQSRKEAVQDALAKAKDFAEAAGYKSVKPFEITDVYSGEEYTGDVPGIGKVVRGDDDTALSSVPEEIHLRSNVTVKLYAE